MWVGAVALVLACSVSARAQTPSGCPEAIAQWAATCPGSDARLERCPGGHAIVAVGPGRLRVDLTRIPADAFVAVGELGASPIGEFASWTDVPRPDRDAFDALVACARERPQALLGSLQARPTARRSEVLGPLGGPLPWRLVLGVLVALGVVVSRVGARELARRAGPALALGAATLVVRRLAVPESYFHQNGQGPLWIEHARGEPSDYGPGYAQVFHWAAGAAADPDGAVFLVQSILAALVPVAAWAIARGLGAPRAASWAVAVAVAASPIHARLAHGESYFATCGVLLVLAAAVLVACVRSDAPLRQSAAGVLAAGLLVAQAALVHPLTWLAAAMVPWVLIVGPGPVRARLRLAALATLGIGVVVLVTAGLDLLAVLRGPLGAQWLAPTQHAEPRTAPSAPVLVGVAAIALAVTTPRLRAVGVAVAVLAATVTVGWSGDLLGKAPPWVHHAYALLHAGPVVAVLAALAREATAWAPQARRSAVSAGTAAAALGLAVAWQAATLDDTLTWPTDAREAALVREWREHLPPRAVVAHLERVEDRIVALPLYASRLDRPLSIDEPPGDLTAAGRDVFVYRSSLCGTEEGRAFCDALETEYVLEPLHTATLPAIPSMPELRYDRAEVRVGLYRLRDRRASTTDDGSRRGRDGE